MAFTECTKVQILCSTHGQSLLSTFTDSEPKTRSKQPVGSNGLERLPWQGNVGFLRCVGGAHWEEGEFTCAVFFLVSPTGDPARNGFPSSGAVRKDRK